MVDPKETALGWPAFLTPRRKGGAWNIGARRTRHAEGVQPGLGEGLLKWATQSLSRCLARTHGTVLRFTGCLAAVSGQQKPTYGGMATQT